MTGMVLGQGSPRGLDPFVRLLHAAFEDIAHAELAADLAGIDGLSLISESGVARDHEDTGTAREVGRERLGNAVGESVVLRAATDLEEGQNHDRESPQSGFAVGAGGCSLAFRPRSRCRWARCEGQLRLVRGK